MHCQFLSPSAFCCQHCVSFQTSAYFTEELKLWVHVILPVIHILLIFCHGLTIPNGLNAFYCFANRLFYLFSSMMKNTILRSTRKTVKMGLPYSTSIYSVSDLEFRGRIFHALKTARNCFNPKFQFLDGKRAPGLNNLKTEQQTVSSQFPSFSHS